MIRYHLAEVYERQRRFADAASTLTGLPVETGQKQMPVNQKMDLYLRIANLLLEDQQYDEAEININRAVHHQTETSPELVTKFKVFSFVRRNSFADNYGSCARLQEEVHRGCSEVLRGFSSAEYFQGTEGRSTDSIDDLYSSG